MSIDDDVTVVRIIGNTPHKGKLKDLHLNDNGVVSDIIKRGKCTLMRVSFAEGPKYNYYSECELAVVR